VRERDLERFSKTLQARLQELVRDSDYNVHVGIAHSNWVAADIGDEADEAQRSLTEDARATKSVRDRAVALQIEAALQRIRAGEFGKCIDCGQEIELQRLRAVPWAQRCISDQQEHERELREHPPQRL
jgi:RNA polymerase-binding protein DksA